MTGIVLLIFIMVLPTIYIISHYRRKLNLCLRSQNKSHLLQSLAVGIATSKDIDTALNVILKKTYEHIAVAAAVDCWLPNFKTKKIAFKTVYYPPGKKSIKDFFTGLQGSEFNPGEGLQGAAWKLERPVIFKNLGLANSWFRKDTMKKTGIKAGFAFPVILSNELIAVLSFYFQRENKKEITLLKNTLFSVSTQLARLLKQKQSENLLQRSELRYHSLVEHAADSIVLTDNNGDIICINKTATDTFEYTEKEILYKPFCILLANRNRRIYKQELCRFITSNKIEHAGKVLELCGLKKNNTEFPIELSLTFWKIKEEVYSSSIIRDVTNRKQEEEKQSMMYTEIEETSSGERFPDHKIQLGSGNANITAGRTKGRTKEFSFAESSFRLINEAIPQIVWTALPDGTIDYYNSRWIAYTGMTLEETRENGLESVIHPSDFKKCRERWKKAIARKDFFEIECRLKRMSDASYRWHLDRGVPLKDEKGEIIKWFGTSTDIHDQKMLDKKKDEFIGIASHELKTPLTSIKAYMQLLERSVQEETHKMYVNKANVHVNRLNELISDLLDVSKIQAGKLQLNISAFSFNSFIDEVIESTQHSTVTHQIVKIGSLEPDISITGDKARLEQVLINLLTNAVKYSPKADKVLVSITQEGNKIKVAVTDFGLGIPEDKISKIFNRFYRVDNVSPKIQGLGIGLFISSEIIKRHQGKIWAESEHGKGSTFYFTLPVNPGKLNL